MSVAKVAFVLYGLIGLLIGLCVALASLLGAPFMGSESEHAGAFGILFGLGAVIFMPILYGGLGAIGALIATAVYNVVAGLVGGIELTTEPATQAR
jgi:hypothetical protein